MTDDTDELIVSVRADTQAFAADIQAMRRTFDGTLLDGFEQAGTVLERGLLGAIRKGSLGFDDLRRVATGALDQIAAQALQLGLDSIFGGGSTGGGGASLGGLFQGALGALFGLPGRAIGGPVAPERPYLVGERGPELFVPTSAGRIEPGAANGRGQDVRVAISLNSPRGTSAPVAMQRSSRQVAAAVRRALLP
ncbi:MAG: tail tape measure protein [Erythrobacter sp.]|jgi:hypothetical protein